MGPWNTRPQAVTEAVSYNLTRKAASKFLFATLACLGAGHWSSYFAPDGIRIVIVPATYVLAAVLSALCLQSFLSLKQTPPWAVGLDEMQRKLLAVDFPAVKPPPLPGKLTTPSPLLAPPQHGRAIAAASPLAADLTGGPGPSPGSRCAAREVTTPEQLRQVLLKFDEQLDATAGAPGGAAPPEYAFAGPAAQPLPQALTTYRPSAVAKGAAVVAARADGRVVQSSPEQKAAAMRQLGVSQESLEEGTERLREWFAHELLQPLEQAIRTAHERVVVSAAQLGYPGITLSPLDQLGATTSVHKTDDYDVCVQVRAWAEGQLRQPAYYNNPQLPNSCLQAVTKYEKLAALLHAEFPQNMLQPPAPAAYVASRISDLANGSCMMDFVWNAGGRWNGKAWSTDLPTDSALLLYLFAAFLAAPQWEFTQEDPSRTEGPGGVLYLGKLPQRVIGEYFAVMPMRPPAGSKATGILGLQLGTQQPHFCLAVSGETLLTESGQNALLEVLVLFLHHCRRSGGIVGGRSLQSLRLEDVAAPALPSIIAGALRLKQLFAW